MTPRTQRWALLVVATGALQCTAENEPPVGSALDGSGPDSSRSDAGIDERDAATADPGDSGQATHDGSAGGGSADGAADAPAADGASPPDAGDGSTDAGRPRCSSVAARCGPNESDPCCASDPVPGGVFAMGRCGADPATCTDGHAGDSPDELPEHPATVSAFSLDRYEVTVGRFREFVETYDGTPPTQDGAAHPLIPHSGWRSSWDTRLPISSAELEAALACSPDATWTSAATTGDNRPINCVSWYEAFAFCAWDGGRLPTESEWEFAAAGGADNRLFPWGAETPSMTHASFACDGCSPDLATAGAFPDGRGRFGQHDLGGNVWEFVLDAYHPTWYAAGGASCSDCANVVAGQFRVARGGGWTSPAAHLRAAHRTNPTPGARHAGIGFRCARND